MTKESLLSISPIDGRYKNKVKDLENYLSDRAKRGLMLPQGYRKVDRVIEVFDASEES